MRSIFFLIRFHLEIIKFFSVTPSAYQIPYSTLKQGVTNLVQLQSSSLNTNARMCLYDTPRDTMAKDPMLQSLCSTSTWKAPGLIPNTSNYLLMCSRASRSTQYILSIMCFRVHAQHKQAYTYIINNWITPNI